MFTKWAALPFRFDQLPFLEGNFLKFRREWRSTETKSPVHIGNLSVAYRSQVWFWHCLDSRECLGVASKDISRALLGDAWQKTCRIHFRAFSSARTLWCVLEAGSVQLENDFFKPSPCQQCKFFISMFSKHSSKTSLQTHVVHQHDCSGNECLQTTPSTTGVRSLDFEHTGVQPKEFLRQPRRELQKNLNTENIFLLEIVNFATKTFLFCCSSNRRTLFRNTISVGIAFARFVYLECQFRERLPNDVLYSSFYLLQNRPIGLIKIL